MARKSRAKTKAARPTTVAAYLASLTPEKRTVIEEARAFVHRHMSKNGEGREFKFTADLRMLLNARWGGT